MNTNAISVEANKTSKKPIQRSDTWTLTKRNDIFQTITLSKDNMSVCVTITDSNPGYVLHRFFTDLLGNEIIKRIP